MHNLFIRKEYLFTFKKGGKFSNRFVAIQAGDGAEARKIMRTWYTKLWDMQHWPPSARDSAGIEKRGLIEWKENFKC